MIKMWKCPTCHNKSGMGVKNCRKCRTEQPAYTIEDNAIVPKVAEVTRPASGAEFLASEAKRQHTNKNDRLVRKIKTGSDDKLFTSTFNQGN